MARAEGILRLLLVDDSLTEADGIINILRGAGHAVRAVREDTLTDVEQLLINQTWDILICRDSIAAAPVLDILALIQRLGKDVPSIILHSSAHNERTYLASSATDVIPFGDAERLQFVVNREIKNLFNRRLARRNERALRESEKRSRALLESSRDAVAYMHEGMHIYVNRAYIDLFGYADVDDIDGLPMLDLISSEDHNKFKTIFRDFSENAEAKPVTLNASCIRADGAGFSAKIEFSHAQVEGEACTQVVIRDDAAFTVDDSQLKLVRDHDLLTGLYTRVRFMEELEQIAFNAAEGKGDSELLFLVLDDFQMIKEQVGLQTCDELIKSVAKLLEENRQEGEVIARYGDQVFTIIIPNQEDQAAEERAKSYLESVSNYTSYYEGKQIEVLCSIGIARITESQDSVLTILDNADRACMAAQRAGGNQISQYQPEQTESSEMAYSEEKWLKKLEQAIQQDNFSLQFQPIVSLHGVEQEFYEVLLRLKEDDGTVIAAEEFIRYAAKQELMVDIDKWVIRNALDRLAEHHAQFPQTRFFIKLSEQSLYVTDFFDWLTATMDAHSLSGKAVIFEISETAAVANIDKTKTMIARLKELGCEFGLEHFGSGIDFSNSLSILDVEYLKINGAFVENMAHDTENQAAVKAIIEMTKEAGKNCIAEFVSDANSLALLWRLGVDYAQGYYIHEPSDQLDYNFEDDDL